MASKKPTTERTKLETDNVPFSFLNQMRDLEDEKNKEFVLPDEEYFGSRDKAAPVKADPNPVMHVNTTVAPKSDYASKNIFVILWEILYAIFFGKPASSP